MQNLFTYLIVQICINFRLIAGTIWKEGKKLQLEDVRRMSERQWLQLWRFDMQELQLPIKTKMYQQLQFRVILQLLLLTFVSDTSLVPYLSGTTCT